MNLKYRLTIAVVKARVQQKERKIPAEVAPCIKIYLIFILS
jgi:hypothetical protein